MQKSTLEAVGHPGTSRLQFVAYYIVGKYAIGKYAISDAPVVFSDVIALRR